MRLGQPEVAEVVGELYGKEKDGRRKNRLLAVKLVAAGESTSQEIADLCVKARPHLFKWLKTLKEQGLEGLLNYGKPGPKAGTRQGLSPEAAADFEAKLAGGEFVTAVAAQRWLKQAHGVDRPYATVWRWLKKSRRSAFGAAPESFQKRSRGQR